MRYSIMVRMPGSDHMTELCRCGSNPEQIAKGAREKTEMRYVFPGAERRRAMPFYEHVAIIDHEAEPK